MECYGENVAAPREGDKGFDYRSEGSFSSNMVVMVSFWAIWRLSVCSTLEEMWCVAIQGLFHVIKYPGDKGHFNVFFIHVQIFGISAVESLHSTTTSLRTHKFAYPISSNPTKT